MVRDCYIKWIVLKNWAVAVINSFFVSTKPTMKSALPVALCFKPGVGKALRSHVRGQRLCRQSAGPQPERLPCPGCDWAGGIVANTANVYAGCDFETLKCQTI